jgi:arylsulfatase A-like enzyme
MKKKPYNFLIIMVDQERFPPIYESSKIKRWRKRNLLAQELLKEHSLVFKNHYVGATACSPSRATLFTGQYPSLHGVSQTSGAAKEAFDPDMFWLDRNTVPTMGDYFRAAGYQTFYKGKWHVSDEDILIPGTHNALASYNSTTGVPDVAKEELYLKANRLDVFGFAGWIGPEPHGTNPHNSGSSSGIGTAGRDHVYGSEVVQLIEALDLQKASRGPAGADRPWAIVSSFINPHDIALFGAFTATSPQFHFDAGNVPVVPPPPTFAESLSTKPSCQASYREVYPKSFQPIFRNEFYRQVYYNLQKQADEEMLRVLKALLRSSFYEDTIVLFTSDHGELLGAHGNLHQKWYCAYEEAIHVPFLIHNPQIFPKRKSTHLLTSHVDILPTILGMAGIDVKSIQADLTKRFSEIHPFVGRNLSDYVLGGRRPGDAPIYFMTDDDVTQGLHQVSVTGKPYKSVIQPNHIETVITTLRMDGRKELWKYSRYYDNPQFWENPGEKTKKKTRVPDELEMYNLTDDPLETKNLANPKYATPQTRSIQQILDNLLLEQCKMKRLTPTSGTVPGMLCCQEV